MKRFYWVIMLGAFILLEVMTQISSKLAANSLNRENTDNWFAAFIMNPWLWSCLACSVVSFFIWISVLRVTKLSFAFLATSICYVLVMITGWMFFHEKITLMQIAGSGFIMFGIGLLSKIDLEEDS